MKIIDLMTKKLNLLAENATVLDAVNKMQEANCGILPIGDINHVKGVVTDRDIIVRAISKNKDASKTPIKEIMTKEIVFCEEDGFLQQAIHQMNQHHMRRVLVKNKNQQLSGILSLGDIIRRVQDKSLLASLFKDTNIA